MPKTSRRSPCLPDPHHDRSPLMHQNHLFDPPGKSSSSTEEYTARSPRHWDMKQIKNYRSGATSSPITARPPSSISASSFSGDSRVSNQIFFLDCVQPLSTVTHPFTPRLTSPSPLLNTEQVLHSSAFNLHASKASAFTRSISGARCSQSSLPSRSNTVVSCYSYLVLISPNSGRVSHSRAFTQFWRIPSLFPGARRVSIHFFERVQPLSLATYPSISSSSSSPSSSNSVLVFLISVLNLQVTNASAITKSKSGARQSHSPRPKSVVSCYLLLVLLSPHRDRVFRSRTTSQFCRSPPFPPSYRHLSLNPTSSVLLIFNPQTAKMENNQGQPSNQGQSSDPMGKLFNNKECNMCLAHTIMINSIKKQLKDLSEDYHADRESKRKKLGKRKKEIEALKDRCIHMEAVIDHLRTLTESNQAEASTKASAQKDESVTPHFP